MHGMGMCIARGVHGRGRVVGHVWGGMYGRQGACMVVGVHGGMYAGETATEADGCEKVNSSDI